MLAPRRFGKTTLRRLPTLFLFWAIGTSCSPLIEAVEEVEIDPEPVAELVIDFAFSPERVAAGDSMTAIVVITNPNGVEVDLTIWNSCSFLKTYLLSNASIINFG